VHTPSCAAKDPIRRNLAERAFKMPTTGRSAWWGEETLPVVLVQAAVSACAVQHGPLAVEWCAEAAAESGWEPRFYTRSADRRGRVVLLPPLLLQCKCKCRYYCFTGKASESTSPSVEIHVLGHFAQDGGCGVKSLAGAAAISGI
jgi:hypothetical protein